MKIAFRHERRDGFQLVGASTGASVELYAGRDSFTVVELNFKAARALLLFLVKWWIVTGFGVIPRFQQWRLSRALDEKVSRAAS